MASQPPANLPVFYQNIQPLSSSLHASFKAKPAANAPYLAKTHAVPVTVDEFIHAQRNYPIVFSQGDSPIPLVLMGLNEGVNVFVDDEGALLNPVYIPAYVRRYPYMLARLEADAQELSLCFDPTSDLIGPDGEGNPLFEDGKPTDALNGILKFCEDFEMAAQRTQAFMKELQEMELLMDGEVAIQPGDADKPFVYRGFQMIAEDKFREMNGDQLRKLNQNGILPLIVAHLFSLSLVRDLFTRQMVMGKVPQAEQQDAPAEA